MAIKLVREKTLLVPLFEDQNDENKDEIFPKYAVHVLYQLCVQLRAIPLKKQEEGEEILRDPL